MKKLLVTSGMVLFCFGLVYLAGTVVQAAAPTYQQCVQTKTKQAQTVQKQAQQQALVTYRNALKSAKTSANKLAVKKTYSQTLKKIAATYTKALQQLRTDCKSASSVAALTETFTDKYFGVTLKYPRAWHKATQSGYSLTNYNDQNRALAYQKNNTSIQLGKDGTFTTNTFATTDELLANYLQRFAKLKVSVLSKEKAMAGTESYYLMKVDGWADAVQLSALDAMCTTGQISAADCETSHNQLQKLPKTVSFFLLNRSATLRADLVANSDQSTIAEVLAIYRSIVFK